MSEQFAIENVFQIIFGLLTRLHQGIGTGILLQLPLLFGVYSIVHVYGVAVQDTRLLITKEQRRLNDLKN